MGKQKETRKIRRKKKHLSMLFIDKTPLVSKWFDRDSNDIFQGVLGLEDRKNENILLNLMGK